MPPNSPYKVLFSIGFLSAAIIAFQLALIQILSYVQWYHFAYMVISVALLGFGAAGTLLAIFKKRLIKRSELLLPLLMIVTGILMAVITDLSQQSFFRFDSYLLFAEYSHGGKLLLSYLLFFTPFFCGALAIGIIFIKYVEAISKVYFANLLGSGAGGIIALALIWLLFPKQIPAVISILPVLAGIMLITKKYRVILITSVFLAGTIITWKIIHPPQLQLSQYKDLSKTLLLPDASITHEKTSPYGVMQTVTSPVLRYAPGLSLTAQTTAQIKMAVFVNGDWFGPVTDWQQRDTTMILDYTTFSLPYVMKQRNNVLVLASATGYKVAHAVSRGAGKIAAVEPNNVVVNSLKKNFASETDSLFHHPAVTVHHVEPRTFILTNTSRYDLITLPSVGTFGGSVGLFALQEQFYLTKEAFREMWLKLNAGGAISITSWMDYPVRNPLKILATLVETLDELDIKDPQQHLAAVRSWNTITYVMTRSPLTDAEISNIRTFCDEMMFDPAILPHITEEEQASYNEFQDNRFFDYIKKILSQERYQFYKDYDFNIRPATDNQPYFSQFIKWNSLNRLSSFFSNRTLPFFEIGYLLIVVTLVQILILSFILIILPLFKIGWSGKNKLSVVLYFTGIGLGFMFVEMVFIQRFILYFGNPVYSASAVITSLLIFSGIGSYTSGYFISNRKYLLMLFAAIVLLLTAYAFLLTPVLQQTIHLALPIKALLVLLLVSPLAFCMGIPFPAGISYVSKTTADVVPWAWGINGCVSVISTAVATIVAVEMGFTWVMLFAALAYCLPLVVQMRWGKREAV